MATNRDRTAAGAGLLARPGGLALMLCIGALVVAAAAIWMRKPPTLPGAHPIVGTARDDVLVGTDGPDVIQGGPGNDRIDGRGGADTLRGGQGNDVIAGGDGDDWISGDRGDDTLSGGRGADTFYEAANTGSDVITDFDAAEGDRLVLAPGVTYAVRQDGPDAVVDLPGGRVRLKGVNAASLPQGWIHH